MDAHPKHQCNECLLMIPCLLCEEGRPRSSHSPLYIHDEHHIKRLDKPVRYSTMNKCERHGAVKCAKCTAEKKTRKHIKDLQSTITRQTAALGKAVEALDKARSLIDTKSGDGDCCYVPDDSDEDHTDDCPFGVINAALAACREAMKGGG